MAEIASIGLVVVLGLVEALMHLPWASGTGWTGVGGFLRQMSLGVVAALVVSTAFRYLYRKYTRRDLTNILIEDLWKAELSKMGTVVAFERKLKVKMLAGGTVNVRVGLGWSGDANLRDALTITVDGEVTPIEMASTKSPTIYNVAVHNAHKGEKHIITMRAVLNEPKGNYEKHFLVDSAVNSYSVFARIGFKVECADDAIFNHERVEFCEWTAQSDYVHELRSSIRTYPYRRLASKDGRTLEHYFFPEAGHTYTLDFPFTSRQIQVTSP